MEYFGPPAFEYLPQRTAVNAITILKRLLGDAYHLAIQSEAKLHRVTVHDSHHPEKISTRYNTHEFAGALAVSFWE